MPPLLGYVQQVETHGLHFRILRTLLEEHRNAGFNVSLRIMEHLGITDPIVIAQVNQLPTAFAILVVEAIYYQHIENRPFETPVAQRITEKSSGKSVDHLQVVADIHSNHWDVCY